MELSIPHASYAPTTTLSELLERCAQVHTAAPHKHERMMRRCWAELCEWLEQAPEHELTQAVMLLGQSTRTWPASICSAPASWLASALAGRPDVRLNLVKRAELCIANLSAARLTNLLHHPNLRHVSVLRLHDGTLGDVILEALSSSPWLTNLRELYVERAMAGDEGIKALMASRNLAQLEVLSLAGNQLTDEAVIAMTCERSLKSLRELYLGHNTLGDVAARAISISSCARNLRALGLSHNQDLGPIGLRALRQRLSIGLYRLESLDVLACGTPQEDALELMGRVKHLANARQIS